MFLEDELTELQRQQAKVDLLMARRWRPRPDFIEFLVLRNLKIKMYEETGHLAPHIHVDYGREHHVASYSIHEARQLTGTLDTKYDSEVVAWITKHRDRLLDTWATLQAGQDPGPLITQISGGT